MATGIEDQVIPNSNQDRFSSSVRERVMAKIKNQQPVSSIRDETRTTRFDEPRPLPPHTSHSSQGGRGSSLRWKMLSVRLPEAIEKSVEDESFLFFTGTAEGLYPLTTETSREETERERTRASHENSEVEEDGSEGSSNGGSRSNHDGSELGENERASLRGQSPLQLLHPPSTVYIPQRVRLEREGEVLFTPSLKPAVEDVTSPGGPPRYHDDDDGLYVGRRPRVKWTNHVTVKNRLLHRADKGKGWFSDDGLILSLPDPLQPTPSLRPTILIYDPTRNIHTPPAKKVAVNRKLIPGGPSSYRLDLTLSSLHFSHHPLFSLEHVLSSRLRVSCSHYTSLTLDHTYTDYLLNKLYALKTAVLDLKTTLHDAEEDNAEMVEKGLGLRRYLREIVSLRKERRERESQKH